MELRKLFWAARAISYSVIFGKIGKKSYLGRPISLIGKKNIIICDKVRIYPGARMEAHNNAKIIVHENTSIAQNFHITAAEEELSIGKDTTISGNVFITNIDHQYQDIDSHILDQGWSVKTTKIGDGCFIGYGAAIQAGTILGKHCVVGTNAVVRGHYPDYCVLVGVPARVVKKYNIETKKWERIND